MTPWLTVVGVGEGGVAALPASARALIAGAAVVLGPERLFAGLPPSGTLPLAGRVGEAESQELIAWTSPLAAMLEQVTALRGTPTVVLASGDPMWFGIGATLAKHISPTEFRVEPGPSAFQLAAARLRWPLQHVATISLHGRAVEAIHPHILPGNRILALTSDHTTVAGAAKILVTRGFGESLLTVLENLGGEAERITSATAATFDAATIGEFHTLAIDCVAGPGAALLPPLPGLPDEAFISDGQLTKREVRAATLGKLAPYPGALLWDVGAGCGSVAIEWLRGARDARAIAFERDGPRREMIAENGKALGAPTPSVIGGEAPASLSGQPTPDAIFLGGDVGSPALFEACWSALRSGGRIVANAVTVDGEQALYARQAELGGDLARIDVATLDRIGAHRVMRPRMAVTQWLGIKP